MRKIRLITTYLERYPGDEYLEDDDKAEQLVRLHRARYLDTAPKKEEYPNKMMTSDFTCPHCKGTYKSKSGLRRHISIKH